MTENFQKQILTGRWWFWKKTRAWRVSRNNSGTHIFLHVSILSLLVTLQLHSFLHFVKASLPMMKFSTNVPPNECLKLPVYNSIIISFVYKVKQPYHIVSSHKVWLFRDNNEDLVTVRIPSLRAPKRARVLTTVIPSLTILSCTKGHRKMKRAKSSPCIGLSSSSCDDTLVRRSSRSKDKIWKRFDAEMTVEYDSQELSETSTDRDNSTLGAIQVTEVILLSFLSTDPFFFFFVVAWHNDFRLIL